MFSFTSKNSAKSSTANPEKMESFGADLDGAVSGFNKLYRESLGEAFIEQFVDEAAYSSNLDVDQYEALIEQDCIASIPDTNI